MSQQSLSSPQERPKKFLKKGEGLKRFAAYRPPLPKSTIKANRRQTFSRTVKFDSKSPTIAGFFDPVQYGEDVDNLSTEIPKVAPPKIMHTPIRPNRSALGPINSSQFNYSNYTTPMKDYFNSPSKNLGSLGPNDFLNEKNLTRKVTQVQPRVNRKISYEGFRRPSTPKVLAKSEKQETEKLKAQKEPVVIPSPLASSPDSEELERDEAPKTRYNLRGGRKQASNTTNQSNNVVKKETKKPRRALKAVVERHIPLQQNEPTIETTETTEDQGLDLNAKISGNIDNLMKKIEKKKSSLETQASEEQCDEHASPVKIRSLNDLSTPVPGTFALDIERRLQQMEIALNELREKVSNCTCGGIIGLKSDHRSVLTTKPQRNVTRSKNIPKNGPSANVDNRPAQLCNTIHDQITQLWTDVDRIKHKK